MRRQKRAGRKTQADESCREEALEKAVRVLYEAGCMDVLAALAPFVTTGPAVGIVREAMDVAGGAKPWPRRRACRSPGTDKAPA